MRNIYIPNLFLKIVLRKLTSQGPKDRNSYTVTLPIEWIKKNNLDKSKTVELVIAGPVLIIKTEGEKTKVEVNAKTLENSITRVLQILYKKGVDEIKVIDLDQKRVSEIYEVIQTRCIGYEIIEHKKDCLLIKDIAKEASENFETLLRRCFLLVLEMTKEKDKKLVENYDNNLNKLSAYCLRLLVKQGHKDFELMSYYARLCNLLENFGDDLILLLKNNKKPSKKIIEYLHKCYDLFYNFNNEQYDNLQNIIGSQRHIKKELFDHLIMQKLNGLLGLIYAIKG